MKRRAYPLFTPLAKILTVIFLITLAAGMGFYLSSRTAIAKDSSAIFDNDDALKQYVKKYGGEQTIVQLDALSARLGDCHEQAHKAGRLAYETYGDKAFRANTPQCHSGYYHGAIEEYFKEHGTAHLADQLKVLCQRQNNNFMAHQCIHGMGHGLMAWTSYDLTSTLNYCDLLPERQASCWSGAFMENIVGGLADESGHTSQFVSSDPHYPCNAVAEKYQGTCYFLQTDRMLQLFNNDLQKVSDECMKAPAAYQRSCFESLGRDVGGMRRNDPSGAIGACQVSPPGEMRIGCLVGAAQDSFWDASGQTVALQFCQLLTDGTEKQACYGTIFGRAPDVLLSQSEREEFCRKAEVDYRAFCEQSVRKT